MNDEQSISFLDEDVLRCPFPAYAYLHERHPVYVDPKTGIYVITKYDDVRQAAQNTQAFSSRHDQYVNRAPAVKEKIDAMFREHELQMVPAMVDNDPPQHMPVRKLVDWAFRAARINGLKGYIEECCNRIVDGFIDRGAVEIVTELATPLPVRIIADQLGIEENRIKDIKRWSDALLMSADFAISPEEQLACNEAVLEMRLYLTQRMEEMRRNPQNNIISDVAKATLDGKPLPKKLAASILSQLLVAGNETTTATIALGTQLLIENNLEQRLRQEPQRIPDFVEECLRLGSPLQGLLRRATADIEIRGVKIPAGAMVMLRFGAGNRDSERFECPEQLRLERPSIKQHLAFGFGPHFCVGNALARMELNIVFNIMLSRMANLQLAGEPEQILHSFARGLAKLPVSFDRIK